jgi:hypothetical protein
LQYFGEDEGALGQIYVGLLQLKMGDYLGVNVHMSAILTFVNDCLTDEDAPLNIKDKIPNGKGELGFNKILFALLDKIKVTKIYSNLRD